MPQDATALVAEVRGRLAAALMGPWFMERDRNAFVIGRETYPGRVGDFVCLTADLSPESEADATLIAHAPADLADLCDAVERAEDDVARLRGFLVDEVLPRYVELFEAAGLGDAATSVVVEGARIILDSLERAGGAQ
ncbi:MAG TPA: hypothetical protein VEA41_14225 [Salinarimonas sp.]|nr:hypothetical protein [Salinarimonas sp.]